MANTITCSTTAMEYAGSGAQAVDPAVGITGDDPFTGDVSVQIVSGLVTTEDVLANGAQLPPSITVEAYSAATGLLEFHCDAADIQAIELVLQAVTYTNTGGANRNGSQRRVRFTVDPDTGTTVTADRYIWIRDPFTQIETELWAILAAHPSLSGIIKPVKFTGEDGLEDDALDTYQEADLAVVRLHPSGNSGQTNLSRVSNGSTIGQRFVLEIVSGNRATRMKHNPVKWGVAKALAKHMSDHRRGTTPLLGLGPVNSDNSAAGIVPQLSWQVVTEAGEQESADRGAVGWIALMAIDVTLWISDAQARV